MKQLRSWHRRLLTAHSKACAVAAEAEAVLGYDDAVIIMDPIIELHSALHNVEGLIEERQAQRRAPRTFQVGTPEAQA